MGLVVVLVAVVGFGAGFTLGVNGLVEWLSERKVPMWQAVPLGVLAGVALGSIAGGASAWFVAWLVFPG